MVFFVEEYELKERSKTLSKNEANCVRLNRVMKRNLDDQINQFNKDLKFSNYLIKESQKMIVNIQKDIQISTGSAFNDAKPDQSNTTTNTGKLSESFRFIPMAKQSNIMASLNRSSTALDLKSKLNLEKYIDPNNRVEYKAQSMGGSMKSIPGRCHTAGPTVKGNMSLKQEDLVEWNKYLLKNRMHFGHHESDFVFHDKNIYKAYLELCETRDSIPNLTQEKIEKSVKKDPIFMKRYRQYLYAKSCNKAPKFDINDYLISPFFPKYTMEKQKQAIIREKNTKLKSVKIYQLEMDLVNQRAKNFIKEIEIL